MQGDAPNPLPSGWSPEAELRRINEKVDLLAATVQSKKPWYRDVSSIVALSAFVISLLTTVFSGIHGYRQDIETTKNQLNAVISQVAAINMQLIDAQVKYEGKPFLSDLTAMLNGQAAFQAKRAYSIVVSLDKYATAPDLQMVAGSLGSLNETALSEKLLDLAKSRIENVVEYMAVYRQSGSLKIFNHEIGEGNADFQRAADVFSQYPKDANNSGFVFVTNFSTQIQWAGALLSVDCHAAFSHVDQAEKMLNDQARGNQNFAAFERMKADLSRLRATLITC